MTMLRVAVAAILLAAPCLVAHSSPQAQEAKAEFSSHNDLFAEFNNRREVVLTKLEKLYGQKEPSPEEIRKLEDELRRIDLVYCDALAKYIKEHPDNKDLEYSRYELALTLSKFEEKLADAVKACDEFLAMHAKSDLAPSVKWARAQSYFRMPGSEAEALKALDAFIADHGDTQEGDMARMMRVRALLFANNVEGAKKALTEVMALDKVKNDADARAFVQRQIDDLDWIGRDLPVFSLADMEEKAVSTADMKGNPALIFVWDSTSGVCLEEIGFVKALHDKYKDKGLKVVGFSINESKPAIEQWLKRNATGFANVWEDRAKENGFVKRLDVRNIPFNVLVDKEGKIFRYDVRSDELLRHAELLMK
ncbi:MAG: redoxin domain-containing protein [Planctomycetes bacterium]|nr:redoxin domain-containing protein [Planctomycetota bacterium]